MNGLGVWNLSGITFPKKISEHYMKFLESTVTKLISIII
jgi:hypothetical protein